MLTVEVISHCPPGSVGLVGVSNCSVPSSGIGHGLTDQQVGRGQHAIAVEVDKGANDRVGLGPAKEGGRHVVGDAVDERRRIGRVAAVAVGMQSVADTRRQSEEHIRRRCRSTTISSDKLRSPNPVCCGSAGSSICTRAVRK